MSSLPGTVINGRLVPTDSLDTYYLLEDKYLKGGYRSVADITERDAITAPRRTEGMLVGVLSDGKIYQLVGGTDNVNWQELVTGGGGMVAPYVTTVNGVSGAVTIIEPDFFLADAQAMSGALVAYTNSVSASLQTQIDSISGGGITGAYVTTVDGVSGAVVLGAGAYCDVVPAFNPVNIEASSSSMPFTRIEYAGNYRVHDAVPGGVIEIDDFYSVTPTMTVYLGVYPASMEEVSLWYAGGYVQQLPINKIYRVVVGSSTVQSITEVSNYYIASATNNQLVRANDPIFQNIVPPVVSTGQGVIGGGRRVGTDTSIVDCGRRI